MSEKILIEEIIENNFLSHTVLHVMSNEGIDKFNITPGKTKSVELELKINGVTVEFRSFVDLLERQFNSIVDRKVGERIINEFGNRMSVLYDILNDTEASLKQKLRGNGFLPEED